MEMKKLNMKSKLCYVEDGKAYFTTKALSKQWGDDWNDAPYEHNAGEPYTASKSYSHLKGGKMVEGTDYIDGKPNWEVFCICFDSELEEPKNSYCNSPYCVEDINKKKVPWLVTMSYSKDHLAIYAGTTMEDFIKKIKEHGGKIYLEII